MYNVFISRNVYKWETVWLWQREAESSEPRAVWAVTGLWWMNRIGHLIRMKIWIVLISWDFPRVKFRVTWTNAWHTSITRLWRIWLRVSNDLQFVEFDFILQRSMHKFNRQCTLYPWINGVYLNPLRLISNPICTSSLDILIRA